MSIIPFRLPSTCSLLARSRPLLCGVRQYSPFDTNRRFRADALHKSSIGRHSPGVTTCFSSNAESSRHSPVWPRCAHPWHISAGFDGDRSERNEQSSFESREQGLELLHTRSKFAVGWRNHGRHRDDVNEVAHVTAGTHCLPGGCQSPSQWALATHKSRIGPGCGMSRRWRYLTHPWANWLCLRCPERRAADPAYDALQLVELESGFPPNPNAPDHPADATRQRPA
jgi:hypothetical protein